MTNCIHAREAATVLATYRTCTQCQRRARAQDGPLRQLAQKFLRQRAGRCRCGGELSRVIEQCVCAPCNTRWERWLDGKDNHDSPIRPGRRFGG